MSTQMDIIVHKITPKRLLYNCIYSLIVQFERHEPAEALIGWKQPLDDPSALAQFGSVQRRSAASIPVPILSFRYAVPYAASSQIPPESSAVIPLVRCQATWSSPWGTAAARHAQACRGCFSLRQIVRTTISHVHRHRDPVSIADHVPLAGGTTAGPAYPGNKVVRFASQGADRCVTRSG
jgi:hypothetical protein